MIEKEACITSLFISPRFRDQKWGARLLDTLEKEINDYGCPQIILSTLCHNPDRHLFDKRGYERVQTENGWIHYKKALH